MPNRWPKINPVSTSKSRVLSFSSQLIWIGISNYLRNFSKERILKNCPWMTQQQVITMWTGLIIWVWWKLTNSFWTIFVLICVGQLSCRKHWMKYGRMIKIFNPYVWLFQTISWQGYIRISLASRSLVRMIICCIWVWRRLTGVWSSIMIMKILFASLRSMNMLWNKCNRWHKLWLLMPSSKLYSVCLMLFKWEDNLPKKMTSTTNKIK